MTYPLSFRLIERLPIHPIFLCLILMFVLGGGYTLLAFQSGLVAEILDGRTSSIGFRASFTAMLLIAYIPIAQYYLIKWSQQHWESLSVFVHEIPALDIQLNLWWGLTGMFLQFGLFFSAAWIQGDVLQSGFWNLEIVASQIFVVAVGWFLYRLLVSLIKFANQFSRVAKALPKIDLFDNNLSKIFVKQGVRSALLIIGFISICGNIIVAPGSGIDAAILIGVASSICAVIAFIIPALGIQKRTHTEKQKQLTILRKEIQAITGGGSYADMDWSKLSGLLSLEVRLQNIREWPFDASSISRFVFYIAIGLSSWIGAALVEKLIDSFL